MWSFFKRKSHDEQPEPATAPAPRQESAEPLNWYVVAVNLSGGEATLDHLVTPLAPAEYANGLPPEAIAGRLDQPPHGPPNDGSAKPLDAAGFARNRTFHQFLHHVIATHGPTLPELIEGARQQGQGSMAIIDLRTPEGIWGNVPPDDIIGLFSVQSGKLGEYHANDDYCAFTASGLMQLEPKLAAVYRMELLNLCKQRAQS